MPTNVAPANCVLVTRPAADARETAARLIEMGLTPLICPALAVSRTALRLPGFRPWQAILLTSGNALAGLPASLHATPLLAVGNATAARARAAGFARVGSAGRDAAALVDLVERSCSPDRGTLLLPTGAGHGIALTAALRARGFRVARRVVYATRAAEILPPAAHRALADRRVMAALFFSPGSARAFVRACRAGTRVDGVRAVAISAATAAALAPLRWADIRVASQPNQDELLACLT